MPFPGVQVYVVQVIQSVVLRSKNNVRTIEAELIRNTCIDIDFLTLYLPPNTYPLFPTVAQAWAALGSGLFPYRPHKTEAVSDWMSVEYLSIFSLWILKWNFYLWSEFLRAAAGGSPTPSWTSVRKCVGLTVVTGWLHVDVSRSRMWMWLFQPRPGLSPCGRSPTCYATSQTLVPTFSHKLLHWLRM